MANKSGVPGALRKKIFKRDGYTCQKCSTEGWLIRWPSGSFTSRTTEDGVYLSVDHITPRIRGGGIDEENLRCLCTLCNSRKGAK